MPLFTKDGPMPSGLQLWIDLPAEKKMMEPAYYEHKASEIPTVTPSDGVSIKVIAGEAHGAKVRPTGCHHQTLPALLLTLARSPWR
jgi:redox-sensitive bicupin YhaK (pirin superfamily)